MMAQIPTSVQPFLLAASPLAALALILFLIWREYRAEDKAGR